MTPVQEFYAGRSILVTGGTGFMGKVLLEKIVRCLPGVKKIYVLIRAKKGLMPQERIKALISTVPFTLQNIDPSDLRKLVAISGDTGLADLGLSKEDRLTLINEVSVVFHLAAGMRMDMCLKEAVTLNVLGTHRFLSLCKEMKNLVSVVHLSTAYCNVEIECMEEKVYTPAVDPYKLMNLVQWMDDECLKRIEKSIIRPHPNTYTFSKQLAETVAYDMGKNMPISICRPSIVIPAYEEPAPGWVDNYNGPTGILVAGAKGVLRTGLMDRKSTPQIIPVDIAINALIISAYYRAANKLNDTPVYNVTQDDFLNVTWGDILDKFRVLVIKYPYKKMFWYPSNGPTDNHFEYYLVLFFAQIIPAYVVDFLLILAMQKPFLVNVQKRLLLGSTLLQYFAVRNWTFKNNVGREILTSISPQDLKTFYILNVDMDIDKYIQKAFFGCRKYLVKEDLDNIEYYRFQLTVLYVLDKLVKVMLLYGFFWLILYLFNVTHLLPWNNKNGFGFINVK